MGAGALGFKFSQAVEGGFGDFAEGVIGEKGLVAGDEDVGEGEKPGKHVIRQDVGGVVGKEEASFLFIHVNRKPADVAVLEAGNDRMGVKNGPAAGVDEDDPFFHFGEGGGVDQVARGRQERHVEGEDVGFPQDLLLIDVAGQRLEGGFRNRIVGENTAPKAAEIPHHLCPDGAGANHADGFLFQLEPVQSLELEIVVADALAGAGNVTGERKDQAEGEFGDRMGGIGGNGGNGDAQLPGGRNIDVVEAGAEGGHQAGSSAGENLQSGAIDPVVDEDHDRGVAGRKGCGGGFEASFEEVKLVVRADRREGFFEVVATTEDKRPHPRSLR